MPSKPKYELSNIYQKRLGKSHEEIKLIFFNHDLEISNELTDEFIEGAKGISVISNSSLEIVTFPILLTFT